MLQHFHRNSFLLIIVAVLSVSDVGAFAGEVGGRLPVPDKREVASAMQSLRKEMSEDDSDDAEHDSPEAFPSQGSIRRANKATELTRRALEEPDPTVRFAMLSLAIEWRLLGESVEPAMRAIDTMAEHYDVDPHELKLRYMRTCGRVNSEMLQTVRKMAVAAIAEQRWQALETIAAGASEWARALRKGSYWTSEIQLLPTEIAASAKPFRAVNDAIEKLERDPKDRAANLLAGRYYCFMVNDWATGLPHLAAGSDARLADLARKDLAFPTDPKEQALIGDGWLAAGARENPITDIHINARAAHWFQHAVLQLQGNQRVAVEERLDVAEQAMFRGRLRGDRIDATPFRRLVAAIPNDLVDRKTFDEKVKLTKWLGERVEGQIFVAVVPLRGNGKSSDGRRRYLNFAGPEFVHGAIRYRVSIQSTLPVTDSDRHCEALIEGEQLRVRGEIEACTIEYNSFNDRSFGFVSIYLEDIQIQRKGR